MLLIEAGPTDNCFWVKTPIGYGMIFHDETINRTYYMTPETGLRNRTLYWPRGKILGGSSSINALVCHHGQPSGYDDWAAAGNPGWDYHAIKPVYDGFEDVIRTDKQPVRTGKLTVSDVADENHPLKSYFLAVANEMGLQSEASCHLNCKGIYPYFITTNKGERC